MIITRQNPKGGPALKGYPIEEDPRTGILGYKIGYCSCGCREPLLMRIVDVRDIVEKFIGCVDEYNSIIQKLRRKEPLRNKIIAFLGGRVN
jgi:hypothetical protein